MAILKNQVYKTKTGKLLKVVKVTESGFHHLREVDINGDDVKDKRNSFGHVVHRANLVYSEETIQSFKLWKSN